MREAMRAAKEDAAIGTLQMRVANAAPV